MQEVECGSTTKKTGLWSLVSQCRALVLIELNVISQIQKDKCTTLFPHIRNPDLFRKKKDMRAGGFCRRRAVRGKWEGGVKRGQGRADEIKLHLCAPLEMSL